MTTVHSYKFTDRNNLTLGSVSFYLKEHKNIINIFITSTYPKLTKEWITLNRKKLSAYSLETISRVESQEFVGKTEFVRNGNRWFMRRQCLGEGWEEKLTPYIQYPFIPCTLWSLPIWIKLNIRASFAFDPYTNIAGKLTIKPAGTLKTKVDFKPISAFVRNRSWSATSHATSNGWPSIISVDSNRVLLVEKKNITPIKSIPSTTFIKVTVPRFDAPVGIEKKLRLKMRDGTWIDAKWERPSMSTSRTPVVILVHGSGPENGDAGSGIENRDYERSPVQLFLSASRKLCSAGISVLRYDKRFSCKNKGRWKTVSRNELVNDIKDICKIMFNRYDASNIYLLGTSEGANLAVSAALGLPGLSGLILCSGPAESVDKVIIEKTQRLSKAVASEWKIFFRELRRIEKTRPHNVTPNISVKGYSYIWWIQKMNFRPLDEIVKIGLPMLLLHGRSDIDVLPTQFRKLKRTLTENKSDFKSKLFPGLNHFLYPACDIRPGYEYEIPHGFSDEVIKVIVNWIHSKEISREYSF